jgi:AcrR family transcriptional regulator
VITPAIRISGVRSEAVVDVAGDRVDADRGERRESNRANSRHALIDAAFEEFSTKGYEAATVAGIAARAGVTTGALYAHFRGKLHLLLETVGIAPLEDMMRSMADFASLPSKEVAKLLSEGLASAPYQRTLLLLDVMVVARRDPVLAEELRGGFERYLGDMKRATDRGAALRLIDPALASDDLTRVMALVNLGMLIFAALGELPPSRPALARVADLLLHSGGRDDAALETLAGVRARADALEDAQRALDDAIRAAITHGHSLRQVGSAAGVSHERVRRLVRQEPR